MGDITHENRLLEITTPCGDNFLLLRRVSASEGLSQLFSIEVELLHEEAKTDFKSTNIEDTEILGKTVTVAIRQRDGSARYMTGIVSRFSQGSRNYLYSVYSATIVPHVWLLTQKIQTRIFQHQSVPDILKKVFDGFEVTWELQGDFKPRNYCAQYQESDFAFASRLMEEEGIYYYFEHADGMDKMIVANTPQSHRDCPNRSVIPIVVETDAGTPWVSSFRDWRFDYQLQSGKVTNWDYNFQLPQKNLDHHEPSKFNAGGNLDLEIYDFSGGYARKYDGIDKSGNEQASDLNNINTDKEQTVKLRVQALDAHYSPTTAMSDCSSLTAGHKFTLTNHPKKKLNRQYVVVTAQCEYEQYPDYPGIEESIGMAETTITCIPHGDGAPVYRPLCQTPKPVVNGTQTATVVGPSGEEIFTDKYGRVKVQFHWDRAGKFDSDSSCWARVAQTWAGNTWGTMFIPRIGMEVIVDFLGGDPDQPIIIGCVYNPTTMPPYELPAEKTKSTIKSNSSIGGNGFNEFRFEDKKGSEQIFIHGEKDLDIRIKNDAKEIVKNDHHVIVENNEYEQVKGDQHLKVTGDKKEEVNGSVSLKVTGDIQEKASGKYAMDAGTEVHIKAGMKVVIEAGTQVTMKVGGNFVDINPSGVTISGTLVLINSGGSAGSGSGSSPDAPTDPKEADDAKAGKATDPPPAPPAAPAEYSPQAAAMAGASEKGVPFCESGGGGGDKGAESSDSGSGGEESEKGGGSSESDSKGAESSNGGAASEESEKGGSSSGGDSKGAEYSDPDSSGGESEKGGSSSESDSKGAESSDGGAASEESEKGGSSSGGGGGKGDEYSDSGSGGGESEKGGGGGGGGSGDKGGNVWGGGGGGGSDKGGNVW